MVLYRLEAVLVPPCYCVSERAVRVELVIHVSFVHHVFLKVIFKANLNPRHYWEFSPPRHFCKIFAGSYNWCWRTRIYTLKPYALCCLWWQYASKYVENEPCLTAMPSKEKKISLYATLCRFRGDHRNPLFTRFCRESRLNRQNRWITSQFNRMYPTKSFASLAVLSITQPNIIDAYNFQCSETSKFPRPSNRSWIPRSLLRLWMKNPVFSSLYCQWFERRWLNHLKTNSLARSTCRIWCQKVL